MCCARRDARPVRRVACAGPWPVVRGPWLMLPRAPAQCAGCCEQRKQQHVEAKQQAAAAAGGGVAHVNELAADGLYPG
jgi:hypothetical protein